MVELLPANPIGIFDSGIGGIGIVDAIRQQMPHEILLYFLVREIRDHDHDQHESPELIAQKSDRKKPRCQV